MKNFNDFKDLDNKNIFKDILSCLKISAESIGIDPLDVLLILDETSTDKGIREWFNDLASKYFQFTAIEFVPSSRDEPEHNIEQFTLLVTGARNGDVLLGLRTQSKNTVMKIYGGNVPPSQQVIDGIKYYDDLWQRFLNKLNNIPYFSKFNTLEKEIWFELNKKPEDIYIDDISKIKIHIFDIGDTVGNGFSQLPPNILEKLCDTTKNPIPIKDVVEEFPKKPGSSGLKGRHTLIFRRGLWKITILYKEVSSYRGIVLNINAFMFSTAKEDLTSEDPFKLVLFDNIPKTYTKEKGKYIVQEKQQICILVYTDQMKFNNKNFVNVINEAYDELNLNNRIDEIYFSRVKDIFKKYNFTPAGYKSLIQKIIRFGPKKYVTISSTDGGDDEYEVITFLPCVIACLFMTPGSFVPDIQRYVSGIESSFKRVIVTIFEDSYFGDYFENLVYTCMLGAFLAQRLPGWRPTKYMIKCIMMLSIDAYNLKKAFVYDIKRGMSIPPYTINSNSKELEVASALLDEIKSFHSDLGLVRDVVHSAYSNTLTTTSNIMINPITMPLEHCIDQHWTPEIAYMYPTSDLENFIVEGNAPFSKLFIDIFSKVTGVNTFRPPRKGVTMDIVGYSPSFEDRPFVKLTRMAQSDILLSRDIDQPSVVIPYLKTKEKFELPYSFKKEWIAGMVGAIEIKSTKKGPTALVTMNPSEPSRLIAIRKPSRDMKDPFLSDERAEEAILSAREILKKGIHINENVPMESLRKSIFRMEENDDEVVYLFRTSESNEWKMWDNICCGLMKIDYVEDVNFTIKNSFSIKSSGAFKNPNVKLKEILEKTKSSFIRKLLTYLTNKNVIEFKRLGRDGGGTKGIVGLDDVGAYQLFLKIYIIFSFAFSRKKSSALDFYVLSKPCVIFIKNIIQEFLNTHKEGIDYSLYGNIHDSKKRKLWEHQIEAIDELDSNLKEGKRGSFLWLPVGSGKTMIVLEHLSREIKNKTIPPYILYTLPSSAVESVINEISFYGFKYTLIVPLKNIKSYNSDKLHIKKTKVCKLEKYTINLIEHDHLRKCEEELYSYMKDSVLIIDEVHKALNDTKRTSVALQLSHLSKEFIALTGTPIIDSNTYKLIWWLEQIVDFEINKNNFWVAANSMIAKKFVTGVRVEHVQKYEKMTPEEEKKYKSLVPMGLGGTNEHPRHSEFIEAINLCYEVVDRGILESTYSMLKEGRGVFVVAKDTKHQKSLFDRFSKKINPKDIFLITSTDTIFLTDDSIKRGVHDYKIVITTVRKSAGYTLTRLSAMVTGVYPSNNADREQLEGRLNRIGQSSPDIKYITVHTGILTYIMQKHIDAKNLSAVLSALAGDIKM